MNEHNHHHNERKPVNDEPMADDLTNINDALANDSTDDDDLTEAFLELKDETDFQVSGQMTANINNAELMLSYIVNQGIEIPQKIVNSVVKCKYMYQKHKWNPDIEVEFNMTFRELTNLIKPVTVDSLASSMSSELQDGFFDKILRAFKINKRNALAKRSARGYTIGTVVTMVILLTIQIYFYLGSTRLSSVEECESQLNEKFVRANELTILQNKAEDEYINSEANKVMEEIQEIDSRKMSSIELLYPWVYNIRMLTFSTGRFRSDTNVNKEKGDKINDRNNAVIQEAKSYVLILGIYVLPLLYGIIGGFTFVLRELNEEIRNLTFSTGSNVKYLLRILLGAIAGLSVGLFWSDIENAQKLGLSSLSPMLLAFLGGYCVEFLLQFIEKVANSFFKKYDPDNKPKANDEPKPAAKCENKQPEPKKD